MVHRIKMFTFYVCSTGIRMGIYTYLCLWAQSSKGVHRLGGRSTHISTATSVAKYACRATQRRAHTRL